MSIPTRTFHGPPSDASVFSSHHTVSGYRNALKWRPCFASGLLPELLQQKGSECFRGILGEHPNAQTQAVVVPRKIVAWNTNLDPSRVQAWTNLKLT